MPSDNASQQLWKMEDAKAQDNGGTMDDRDIESLSSANEEDIPYAESEDSVGSLFQSQSDEEDDALTVFPSSSVQGTEHQRPISPDVNMSSTSARASLHASRDDVSHVESSTPIVTVGDLLDLKEGDFVAVKYKGRLYPGKIIIGLDQVGEVCISAMSRKGKHWIWPQPPDEIWYKKDQIERNISAPVLFGNDGVFKADLKQ
ncbi:hypothetical protein GE061_018580 [Apolygus lucorum]|uniref:Uncharacterized protein n=1 Tax=Apolygus lucorum TaxID=248454 RepID=A0A8S9XFL0_APOLU|nr:hypothetical protein GE061_018580 [Apolygus lucorum]